MLRARERAGLTPMCRFLGCVAVRPVDVRRELLDAPNPLIRQSEEHDSGWGMAVHAAPDGSPPQCRRFVRAAHADPGFRAVTEARGRILSIHVRRATMGGLDLDNTHPFCHGAVSLCHNGTVPHFSRLLEPGMERPRGQTDTECLFLHLMKGWDPDDVAGSLRRTVLAVVERSCFSALNLLVTDGRRLYAYRLGVFELYWLARADRLLVASERVTDEAWQPVDQDVLLTLDPEDPSRPTAQRLVGDAAVARAEIVRFKEGSGLRGHERGDFAAERAARLTAAATGT
jgi:predicted glutamine amidotransferase